MIIISKRTLKEAFQIPPHSHCLWCRRAIPEGKMFCSRRCEIAYKKWKRKKDLLNFGYLIVGFILMMVAIWVLA